jgi:hypothetical protein
VKLAVVTCYFNALGVKSRLTNFEIFAARLKKQKVPLFVIEALFPGQKSSLAHFANVTTVECESVLWQKESLLNLLVRKLDTKFTGIVWCDADVIFENALWYKQTSRLLKEYAVVQPFAKAIRLPRGARRYVKASEHFDTFAEVYQQTPQLLLKGDFAAHGHTGFAWAARRDIIESHGLYDAMIAGSGDHVMAHAFAGDFASPCIYRILGNNARHIEHFQKWARKIYPQVRGRIGVVPGRLLHLWHGETENRRYVDRNRELAAFDFDPERDIERDANGLWRWGRRKQGLQGRIGQWLSRGRKGEMRDWAIRYFAARKEDG